MNNKLMKKITVLLITIGLIVIPLTGCNSNSKLFEKDVDTKEKLDDNQEGIYTEEDAIDAIIKGKYNINYKGEEFSFDAGELLNLIFPNSSIYVKTVSDTVYQVKIDNETEYAVFEVNFIDETVNEIELFYDGNVYIGEDAHQMMLQLISSIIEENNSSSSTILYSL